MAGEYAGVRGTGKTKKHKSGTYKYTFTFMN